MKSDMPAGRPFRTALWGAFSFCLVVLMFAACGDEVTPPSATLDTWSSYAYPNDLRDVVQVGDDLWMATSAGALKLGPDGFEQFTRRAAGGPTSQDLNSVCVDPSSGIIFFGTADKGVTQFDPATERWRRFEFVPSNEVHNVTCLNNELYVSTVSGFAVRRSASRTDICNEIDRGLCCGPSIDECDFPSFDVRGFAADSARLWAATGAGPAEFDGLRWRARPGGGELGDTRTVALLGDDVFVATQADRGVYRWDPDGAAWQRVDAGLRAQSLGSRVRLVTVGSTLFLACDYGLFQWTGDAWASTGLVDLSVRGVTPLNRINADLAAATRNGLYIRELIGPTTRWVETLAPGPPSPTEGKAVSAAPNGTVWIGTLGGVMALATDGTWSQFRNGVDLAPSDIFAVFADSRSRLWVGKCCCPSPSSCPTQFIDGPMVSSPLIAVNGWSMSEDTAGRLWIGSNSSGVHVLESNGTEIVTLTTANSQLRSTSVRAVAAQATRVWLGHEQRGLQIVNTGGDPSNPDGFTWQTFSGDPGSQLPSPAVTDIAVDGADAWVLTAAFLVQFRDEVKLQQFPLEQGRIGNAVAVDGRGNKWVATSNGVLRLRPDGSITIMDTSNSDLIADEVLDVAVDPVSGDVLFQTRIGTSRLTPGS